MKNKKVFVAMSGGVDSSVAALLLKRGGYDVVGIFMRCFNIDGCQDRDAEDARRVAEKLEIPFYVWDFEDEYKKKVVKYMVDGYRQGITPNPDVMCNKEIKFGLFFDRAIAAGADFVATGHYVSLRPLLRTGGSPAPAAGVRLHSQRGDSSKAGNQARRASESFSKENLARWGLFKAKDQNKDQSYFLWTLTQRQLARCLFPIGEYVKPEVRAIARRAKLSTADKKDSQGICFLGKVAIADFLKLYIKPRHGEILTTSGERIGTHEGIYFYTIGQRHGLDLRTKNRELKIHGKHETRPHYVAEKDVKTNTLIVAEGENNEALYKKEVGLTNVNIINPNLIGLIRANSGIRKYEFRVLARVRYRQPVSPAKLYTPHPSTHSTSAQGGEQSRTTSSGFRLVFNKAQKFVAPGQSAVFYSKAGEMLGGGVIL